MNEKPIVIIGAGVSGLVAAITLAQAGRKVVVLEARKDAGGLAAAFQLGGLTFDSGPYILLDLPGLDWAFQQLGIALQSEMKLLPIDPIYSVRSDGKQFTIHHDAGATAEQFEAESRGAAAAYLRFIDETAKIYERLLPLRFLSRPSPVDVVRFGRLAGLRFLTSSLGGALGRSGLPPSIRKVLSIWSHIAGQSPATAPSPLALVPAMLHRVGAFYPAEGMGAIPRLLYDRAIGAGVQIRFGEPVRRIRTSGVGVASVETDSGELIPAAVISACGALTTYLEQLEAPLPAHFLKTIRRLPLQSPGVMAYLRVRQSAPAGYLRFQLDSMGCSAAVSPGSLLPGGANTWQTLRLIRPLPHGEPLPFGKPPEQHLDELVTGKWWQEGIEAKEVLALRTPEGWQKEHFLYQQSMNPVMTAAFMRRGRFPRRCPFVKGLYFTGSSTHPGQWVSFCAISGVLTARALLEDK